ncbi:MAG: penicillin-binding protein [Calditrichaeota bacterium]|nr:MAG: penicillin-binding protein [Calditrichota bacterium]
MALLNSKFRNDKKNGSIEPRLLATAFMLFTFAGIIALRLLYVQGIQNSKYSSDALNQYLIKIPKDGQRGLIYDRRMQNLVLNEACVSIGLDKSRMNDTPRVYARKLSRLLSRSETWIRRRIQKVSGDFVWLERRVDTEIGSKIATLKLQGIRIEKDTRRNYPHQEVASHILGFTDTDNRGIEGVEYYYNDIFTGQDGWNLIQRDGRGRAVPEHVIQANDPVDGKSVVLSIDLIFQTIATEELRVASRKFNAHSGSVIILEPNTGHVLAMANEPGYNPNFPRQYSIASRRNRAITDAFEPGSTFKIVPFAAMLESSKINMSEAVFCENGRFKFNGRTIRDSKSHGWLLPMDVLGVSSNIGTVKLTKALGSDALYNMGKKFGFGKRTGIQLSGESSGFFKDIPRWSSFSQASLSIGQETSVNSLQLALAYAAIANGGNLLQPRIVRGLLSENGSIEKIKSSREHAIPQRILSPETAAELKRYLVRVVEKGTGKAARLTNIKVAGKTGTAQVPRPDGNGYSNSEFMASFVGFFPADKPEYLIHVVLNTDRENQWGSQSAAPTFKRIAERIAVNLNNPGALLTQSASPKDKNVSSQHLVQIIVPDVRSRRFEIAEASLQDLGLQTVFEGEGEFVKNQFPVSGTKLSPGDEVKLERFSSKPSDGFNKMPKLVGLSLREALNKMAIANLEPMVYGNGKVVRQKPASGSAVKTGIRCVIECESPSVDIPYLSEVN